jgi:hypothetical protein
MTLSKSQYIRGMQCHKSLWLFKNRPDLRETDDTQAESLFKKGIDVGELAKELFPDGVEIVFDPDDFQKMIDKTMELIENDTEVIYESSFNENGIFAMADILVRNGNGWDMYEVKGSTSARDKGVIKKHYLQDAAIQWYTLSQTITLNRAYIIHLNKEYEKNADLNVSKLFSIDDITQEVLEYQSNIGGHLKDFEIMLGDSMPEIDIGKHCGSPYHCDFSSHCWQHIPKNGSVFDISYAMGKQWDLYYQGVLSIDDIPDDFRLGANASLQIEHHRHGEIKIDKEQIRMFLDTIEYPINFFDFETFQNPIPRFNKQRPYQQVPFQYSLHVLYEDGRLEHKEYLGDEHSDPRPALIEQMLDDITPTGSIIAFNQSFEIRQIKDLALFSDTDADELLALNERFVDLAIPFQNKFYYHPNFQGKYSIKVVLPTLFPEDDELNYKNLGSIQNGGDAMDTYANLHLLKDLSKRDEIRKDLLAYCHLDTLAMVKIWEKLHSMVELKNQIDGGTDEYPKNVSDDIAII